MKSVLFCIIAALCVSSLLSAEHARRDALFDGRTFKGWEGETNKIFRIQDGAIIGGKLKEGIPQNEFLCTERRFTNFVLRVKFKLAGKSGNGGGGILLN